jgi:hypothetical protein
MASTPSERVLWVRHSMVRSYLMFLQENGVALHAPVQMVVKELVKAVVDSFMLYGGEGAEDAMEELDDYMRFKLPVGVKLPDLDSVMRIMAQALSQNA